MAKLIVAKARVAEVYLGGKTEANRYKDITFDDLEQGGSVRVRFHGTAELQLDEVVGLDLVVRGEVGRFGPVYHYRQGSIQRLNGEKPK